MNSHLLKLVQGKQEYDSSCVLVKLPFAIGQQLDRYNKAHIGEECLHDKGRESEYHITILYGIKDEVSKESLELLKERLNTSVFKIKLGVVSKFYQEDYDVLKIDVNDYTGKLHSAFELLNENIDNENSYENYHPHITLAYVKKGACEHLVGDSSFEGIEFEIDNVKFSSSDSDKSLFVTFGMRKRQPEPFQVDTSSEAIRIASERAARICKNLGFKNVEPSEFKLVELPISQVFPIQKEQDYYNNSSKYLAECFTNGTYTGRAADYYPIAIDQFGNVIDGHHRHCGYVLAGVERVPMLQVDLSTHTSYDKYLNQQKFPNDRYALINRPLTYYKVYMKHQEDCTEDVGNILARRVPNGVYNSYGQDAYGYYISIACSLPTDHEVYLALEGDVPISKGRIMYVIKDNFEVVLSILKIPKRLFTKLSSLKRGGKALEQFSRIPLWTWRREDKDGNVIFQIGRGDNLEETPDFIDNSTYDIFRSVSVQESFMKGDRELMVGNMTIHTITPIVKYLIEVGWTLEDAIIAATTTCEDCLNILLEDCEGRKYLPEQWAGTECEYCSILKS